MFKLINNDLCVFSMYSGSLLSINIQMNYELNGQLHIECSCEVQCKWLVENQGFPWLWNSDTHYKYTNVPNIVIVENFSALLFFTFYRKPAISILYQLLMVWAFLLKMFEIFTITSLNNFLTHTWKGINFMFRHVFEIFSLCSPFISPSAAVHVLQVVVKTYMDMDQDSEEEKQQYLSLALHLASEFFLRNPNKDVRLLVACCLADIFRIYAPEAPYTSHDKLKVRKCATHWISKVKSLEINIMPLNPMANGEAKFSSEVWLQM